MLVVSGRLQCVGRPVPMRGAKRCSDIRGGNRSAPVANRWLPPRMRSFGARRVPTGLLLHGDPIRRRFAPGTLHPAIPCLLIKDLQPCDSPDSELKWRGIFPRVGLRAPPRKRTTSPASQRPPIGGRCVFITELKGSSNAWKRDRRLFPSLGKRPPQGTARPAPFSPEIRRRLRSRCGRRAGARRPGSWTAPACARRRRPRRSR